MVKLLKLLLVEERSERHLSDHGDRGADGGFQLDRRGARPTVTDRPPSVPEPAGGAPPSRPPRCQPTLLA